MNQSIILANSVIWAAAILGAAIAGAPAFFTVILLPVLASAALLSMRPRAGIEACSRRDQSV